MEGDRELVAVRAPLSKAIKEAARRVHYAGAQEEDRPHARAAIWPCALDTPRESVRRYSKRRRLRRPCCSILGCGRENCKGAAAASMCDETPRAVALGTLYNQPRTMRRTA